ncbi:hypothetical protein GLU01_01190 [Nanohaloarchaea archaeon]|nr:hypothetical protein [Candidatus Nanohaloarchaea archaeon]
MSDHIKYLAFPVAGVVGYFASTLLIEQLSGITGLGERTDIAVLVAASSFITGILVDEVIPGYIEHIREKRSGGDDVGGDIDSDLDLDS